MTEHAQAPRWVWIAGVGHAFIGLTLLFLTIHPLREALDALALDMVQVMSAVQAANGLGLMLLARRGGSVIAPALIAGGVLASSLMIWIIVFTGTHPFDLMVPLGGFAMMAGWVKLLFERA